MEVGAGRELRGAPDAMPVPRLALALAVLLHGLVYLVLLPPWMGEDEPWHVEFACAYAGRPAETEAAVLEPGDLTRSQLRMVERTGAPPADVARTQAEIVASMRRNAFWRRVDFAGWEQGATSLDDFVPGHSESGQPRLYYQLGALGMRLLGVESVDGRLLLLRGLALLCFLAVTATTWGLARVATRDAWIAAAAALIVAWLPMHARQAAIASNDVLVKVFSGAALWLAALLVAGRGRRWTLLAMLSLATLGFATKATAVGVAAPAVIAVAVVAARRWGTRGALVVASIAAGLLVGGALLFWRAAGSQALPDLGKLDRHLDWVLSRDFYRETLRTFLGAFDWYTRDLPAPLLVAGAVFLAAGLAGSVAVGLQRPAPGVPRETRRPVVLLCWIAVGGQYAAMALRGFAAGRFLFPVLPAIGTLVALGLLAPLARFGPRARTRAVLALLAALAIFDGFVLWSGLVPGQYLAWGS